MGLVLAVACLIVALARPQWGFDWESTKQRGLDIIVAIDTSKSMLAEDIAPNRLARAKLAALDLARQAKSDRIGLVAFAGTAFLQCPLTIDDTGDLTRPVHSLLLAAEIPIVEHLRGLSQLPNSGFRFFAVPVKVKNMGTFPVRAFGLVEEPA